MNLNDIVQAWRAVDRAYVDKQFNGQSWFRVRETYLKQEKMRDREETYAAIRKLLASLGDPFTRFLEPEQYAQLKRGTSGSVTGVGVEVAFSQKGTQPPQLMVRSTLAQCAHGSALGHVRCTPSQCAQEDCGCMDHRASLECQHTNLQGHESERAS
jgi:C-terminal processing protease CtpA/Prc